MNIIDSDKIFGLKVIELEIFRDHRGEFVETYNQKKHNFIDENDKLIVFLEDDISISKYSVIRGLHGDNNTWKLVQCLSGEIHINIVDYRKGSSTYMNAESFKLKDVERKQILIPAGCLNGTQCLSEQSIFSYKQNTYYETSIGQTTIKWNDPKLNLYWPISNPILSDRDANAILLK
jgi:dTDP-4-dehydrorhamnose 3,5-epimerase